MISIKYFKNHINLNYIYAFKYMIQQTLLIVSIRQIYPIHPERVTTTKVFKPATLAN